MKKTILLLALLLSISVSSQITTVNTQQKYTNVQSGTANDSLLVRGSDQIMKTIPKSKVLDVIEHTNLSSFPSIGVTRKIYVDKSTNKIYRWNGSSYVELSSGSGSNGLNETTLINNFTEQNIEFQGGSGLIFNTGDYSLNVNQNTLSANRNQGFPNADGTLAIGVNNVYADDYNGMVYLTLDDILKIQGRRPIVVSGSSYSINPNDRSSTIVINNPDTTDVYLGVGVTQQGDEIEIYNRSSSLCRIRTTVYSGSTTEILYKGNSYNNINGDFIELPKNSKAWLKCVDSSVGLNELVIFGGDSVGTSDFLKRDGSNANEDINIGEYAYVTNNLFLKDGMVDPLYAGLYGDGATVISDYNYTDNIYRYGNGYVSVETPDGINFRLKAPMFMTKDGLGREAYLSGTFETDCAGLYDADNDYIIADLNSNGNDVGDSIFRYGNGLLQINTTNNLLSYEVGNFGDLESDYSTFYSNLSSFSVFNRGSIASDNFGHTSLILSPEEDISITNVETDAIDGHTVSYATARLTDVVKLQAFDENISNQTYVLSTPTDFLINDASVEYPQGLLSVNSPTKTLTLGDYNGYNGVATGIKIEGTTETITAFGRQFDKKYDTGDGQYSNFSSQQAGFYVNTMDGLAYNNFGTADFNISPEEGNGMYKTSFNSLGNPEYSLTLYQAVDQMNLKADKSGSGQNTNMVIKPHLFNVEREGLTSPENGFFRVNFDDKEIISGDTDGVISETWLKVQVADERISIKSQDVQINSPSGVYVEGNRLLDEGLFVQNSTTVDLTTSNLNSTYPSARIGVKVYCMSISSGAKIYEKTPWGWVAYSVTQP